MGDIDVSSDMSALMATINERTRKPLDSAVEHPSHYNMGGIEVIDAITAWGFVEGFNRGNVIKYVARAGRKNKKTEIEDLKKAMTYLQFEIERLGGA